MPADTGAASQPPIFLFGTLCHLPLLMQVLGHESMLQQATMPNAHVFWAEGESFPLLMDMKCGAALGVLLPDPSAEDIARLDYYEGAFGYAREPASVETADGPVSAQVYRSSVALEPGAEWSLSDWVAGYGALSVQAAREVMEGFGSISPDLIAARFPMIQARARAILNAQRSPSAPSSSGLTASDITLIEQTRPYTDYFSLISMRLTHKLYDGGMSPAIDRAVFVAADAAIVLPYDPKRDRVLLVEQVRMGPYARGDANPWSLEPIAGRIDAGETAEEAARREAVEEAGLELGALHLIANSYPSPGASTEFFSTFLGITDLPDVAERLGGLESEHEDIRSVLIGFDELLQMAQDDVLSNGPLIMAVWWLASNRDRLRA